MTAPITPQPTDTDECDRLRKELERTKSALETARVYGGDVARQLAAARADADQLRAELDTMTAVAASNRRHVEYMAQELERVVKAVRFVHAESDGRCVTCTEHCDCLDSDPNAKVGDCTHGNAEWPCTTIRTMGDPLGTAAGVAVQAGQPADARRHVAKLYDQDDEVQAGQTGSSADRTVTFAPIPLVNSAGVGIGNCNCQAVKGSPNYPGPWHPMGDTATCPSRAVAGTGQQDTATTEPSPLTVACPECTAPVGWRYRTSLGGVERWPHEARRAAAVTPAADKADGSKA